MSDPTPFSHNSRSRCSYKSSAVQAGHSLLTYTPYTDPYPLHVCPVQNAFVSVKRGKKEVVFEGKLSSLRRIKDLVEEVPAGLECGVACDDFTDWSEGDSIQCYQVVTKSRRLEDAKATTAVDVEALNA